MFVRRSFDCILIIEKDSSEEIFQMPTFSELCTLLAAKGIEILAQPVSAEGPVVLKLTWEKPQ